MSRAPLLLAIFSAVFFVVLLSEPTSSSTSSAVLPSARLAKYLHLQKTLESKGKKKRVTIPDVDTLRSKQSSKREQDAGDFEHHEAHGDHVHMDTKCGAVEHEQMMREKYPELGTKEDFEFLLREKMNERRTRMAKRAEVNPPVTLAVAVTIIHSREEVGTGSNISPAQIASQITVLNDDFGPTSGQGVNCEISFELSVVNRVSYQSKSWQAPGYSRTYIDTVIKPATSVDPNSYLNIWVLNLTSGLLGYAQFPSNSGLGGLNDDGGAAATDGVVINYRAFGTVGTATSPYNGGRTATHEIGHFLGLRHIWGDGAPGQCASDYCDNTPPANQPHYGCPSPVPQSCSNTNQIQNYMDYTDDDCMDRFMSCQRDRMYTVLETSPRRGGLIVFTNVSYDLELTLLEPESGTICLENGDTSVTPEFAIKNAGFETIYNATISIRIDGGSPSNSSFTFPGGLVQNLTMTVSWPSAVDLTALSEDVHSLAAEIFNLNGGIADEDPFSNVDSAVFYLSKDRPESYSQDYEGITVFPPTDWVVTQGGWGGYNGVVGADGSSGISAVSPMYDLNRIGSEYPMTYVSGVTVGEEGSTVTFDIAYAPYTNGTHVVTGDSLSVLVAAQCDDHEQVIYTKYSLSLQTAAATNEGYVPSSSTDWRTESAVINNNNLFGKRVSISFITTTGWGNNLWLDNIRVAPGQNGAASGLSNWLSVVQ